MSAAARYTVEIHGPAHGTYSGRVLLGREVVGHPATAAPRRSSTTRLLYRAAMPRTCSDCGLRPPRRAAPGDRLRPVLNQR